MGKKPKPLHLGVKLPDGAEVMEELLKEIVGEVKSQGEEKKKRRKIVKKVLIVSAVVLLLGCAATPEERYSRMFSGSVGCPASEVKIVNIDTAITETTVLLECKGKRYYCTERRVGAAGTSCAEVR